MVQNAPKISPEDKFQGRFVTIFWSGPTIKIQNVSLSEGKHRLPESWRRDVEAGCLLNISTTSEGPWQEP